MIRHLLREEGVAHKAVAIAGVTRESLTVEARESGEQYRFILPGPELAGADQERCLDALADAAAAPDARYIVASGLPLGVPEDFYLSRTSRRVTASAWCGIHRARRSNRPATASIS